MCYASSCNPLCGNCRPKRIVQVVCPSCGFSNEITRDEYLIMFGLPHKQSVLEKKILERGGVARPACSACGEDLLEVFRNAIVPAECIGNRVICGFPCGRKDDPYREGAMPCPTMVPVGKPASRA